MKLPAGITTISGHSGQSRKVCPARKAVDTLGVSVVDARSTLVARIVRVGFGVFPVSLSSLICVKEVDVISVKTNEYVTIFPARSRSSLTTRLLPSHRKTLFEIEQPFGAVLAQ